MTVVQIKKGTRANSVAATRPDTTEMSDLQLAQAVLDRKVTLRVGEARRLAEAVVKFATLAKKKNAKKTKASKLPRIPGQPKKKKKKKA